MDTIKRDYLRVWRILSAFLLRDYPEIFKEENLSYEIETKHSEIPSLVFCWHVSDKEAKYFLTIDAEANPRAKKNGTYYLMTEAMSQEVAQGITSMLTKLAYSLKKINKK